ncbi:hypothetical protein ACIBG8_04585 [Nonomuraea sp. NPDC050556]|uniref:hypothetical protein n=1 Tax=Nonomuraea sp. NPDC050556 TaxID=3364369 RepID=UPI00379E8FE1
MDLRYKYFGAIVEFAIDGTSFVSSSQVVALVDFTLCVTYAADRLVAGEDAAIDFTESTKVIHFHTLGSSVRVASSTRGGIEASSTTAELVSKLTDFANAAKSRLIQEIPGLADNPVIQRIARTSE